MFGNVHILFHLLFAETAEGFTVNEFIIQIKLQLGFSVIALFR